MASSTHMFGSPRKEVAVTLPDSLTLSEFLWQLPLFHSCRFDAHARHAILDRCYKSLWQCDTAAMQAHFFESQEALDQDIERISNKNDPDGNAMDTEPNPRHTNIVVPPKDLSSQKARKCGHVFDKGEPVYKCRDCGLDDYCVLCSNCFHSTNHDGHNVHFGTSPGSGGCCDCGDAESWKVPLHCTIHSSVPNFSSQELTDIYAQIDPALQESIRRTITTVLNYMLDVFALAPDEVALPKTEDLVSESRSERRTLSQMGIPHRLATSFISQSAESHTQSTNNDSAMEVDMDKENATSLRGGERAQSQLLKSDQDDLYSCVVWNDEAHALTINDTIMSSIGCSSEKATNIVKSIQTHGRAAIFDSTDVEELHKIAQPLANIGLGVTIRPARDIFREHICGLLVDWLKDLVTGPRCFFPSLPNGDAIIRTILSEELCSRWELPLPLAILTASQRPRTNVSDEDDEDASDQNEDVVMSDPDGSSAGQIHVISSTSSSSSSPVMCRNQKDVATIDWDPAVMVMEYHKLKEEEKEFDLACLGQNGIASAKSAPGQNGSEDNIIESSMDIQQEFEEKLRLDYFMFYDLKLWKEIRISFRKLYVATLTSNTIFKQILGKRLARNYSRLAESFLLKDREPENSIILFSVQLLTVPSVSGVLVNDYYFFGAICSTLAAFFLTDHLSILSRSKRDSKPARINCESRAFRTRRYFNAFHDLRYIMNVETIKRALAENPLYLRQYLDLIALFQGMNAQTCQKDTHVEYESEIWVNAFNVTLQIAKCCRQFTDCFSVQPMSSFQDRVSTARVLVLSIARVLKVIDEWTTEPDDVSETVDPASKKPSNPSQVEPGTTAQTYHSVSFKHTNAINVVKYDVASELVSFHHPLHWLLAGILEYANILDEDVLHAAGWAGGFQQAIMLFKTSSSKGALQGASTESLLPILDYSVRTVVFSSQVRAGVWVRNGYGIKNQVIHYREISLRENTYDADVFLLQLGFATVNPSQFLATLLDRFNLVAWFSGDREHEIYDNTQKSQMIEELLNLLIVCVCERANMNGMSFSDKIRREIIHVLGLGPSAYSEVKKRIPERMNEHPDFGNILDQVALYKAPSGKGQYTLKDELYDEIDTYFWHYSPNNRGEAETILKDRWKKAHPNRPEEEFLIVPRVAKISTGPFCYIGELLHTPVFAQLIAYSLWNVRVDDGHMGETVLNQTLHLIFLALIDENHTAESKAHGFRHRAHDTKYSFTDSTDTQELSLFDILLLFRKDEASKECRTRIDWIIDNLMTFWPESVRETIQKSTGYKESIAPAPIQEVGKEAELTDHEKKKKAAMERQQKIIAQFAQAQSQFAEQHQDMYDDDDDDDDEDEDLDGEFNGVHADLTAGQSGSIHRNYSYPTGECLVCQEVTNERSPPYGLLGFMQTSNIWREVPEDNTNVLSQILSVGANLNVEWEDMQIADDNASVSGFPAEKHKPGFYASTCGHLMHIKCFETYCKSIDERHATQLTRNHPENRARKEFMCPLCKSLGNILLPVFWKHKKESSPGVIPVSGDAMYDQFLHNDSQEIIGKLRKNISAGRTSTTQRRNMSSTSKLKESIATLVPSFRSSSTANNDADDGLAGAVLIPSLEPSDDLLARNTTEPISLAALQARLGPFDDGTLHNSIRDVDTAQDSLAAIGKTYKGLFDVLSSIYSEICNDDQARESSAKVNNVDLLWGMLGYTIASVEIATRGDCATSAMEKIPQRTGTLYDQVTSQMQTFLRISCDTVLAYSSIVFEQDAPKESNTKTLLQMLSLGRLKQIFVNVKVDDISNVSGTGQERLEMHDTGPILEDDPFMILVELSLHLVPSMKMDIYPLMRVLLLAELTKTIAGLFQATSEKDDKHTQQQPLPTPNESSCPQGQVDAVKAFATAVMSELNIPKTKTHKVLSTFSDTQLCTIVKFFALPFLRRTALLMIVRFGYIIQENMTEQPGDEVDHLLKVLGLPTFEHLLAWTKDTKELVGSWCSQLAQESSAVMLQTGSPIEISLDMPTPLYLVALPRKFERLMDESMRRKCSKCNSVPSQPALCLLCGTFVCFQSFCCTSDEEGECNLHMAECGGEIGVFFAIKQCTYVLLHKGNGWFMDPPYLSQHGETDLGLKRGKLLVLDPHLYTEFRKRWLQHNIPIFVARQIEATYDVGGWTTL